MIRWYRINDISVVIPIIMMIDTILIANRHKKSLQPLSVAIIYLYSQRIACREAYCTYDKLRVVSASYKTFFHLSLKEGYSLSLANQEFNIVASIYCLLDL